MKTLVVLQLLLCCAINAHTQGTDCSSAISINLNGSLNNYSTSSTTGPNVVCTDNGTTPITWFQFTTDATAQCPLLSITASDGQAVEVAMYTSCAGAVVAESSICLYDGQGLWSPAHDYTLAANQTYYLRIKTVTPGATITIAGQHYTPPNDDCFGATPVDGTPINDNNSCHHAGPGVTNSQLCATTLENTAFYYYYVATPGTTVININNISCDNTGAVSSGFQIGFFTGDCASLTSIHCDQGAGSFVQATTGVLPADTKVYVAIDGVGGSNCSYSLQALNAYVLNSGLKNFSAWKANNGTILKWISPQSNVQYFEIEKSEDGHNFFSIGRVNSSSTTSTYNFKDTSPLTKAWYRLKQVFTKERIQYSNIIMIRRDDLDENLIAVYTTSNSLKVRYNSINTGRANFAIINIYGQSILRGSLNYHQGLNQFEAAIPNVPIGKYYFVLSNKDVQFSKAFLKLN